MKCLSNGGPYACVYDRAAKRALIEAALLPGVSVARLALAGEQILDGREDVSRQPLLSAGALERFERDHIADACGIGWDRDRPFVGSALMMSWI